MPSVLPRLTVFATLFIAALGVAYLAVVNDTATRGYALARARSQIDRLQAEQLHLQTDVAAARRWEALAPKFEQMGLRIQGGVAYADLSAPHAVTTAFAPTATAR